MVLTACGQSHVSVWRVARMTVLTGLVCPGQSPRALRWSPWGQGALHAMCMVDWSDLGILCYGLFWA